MAENGAHEALTRAPHIVALDALNRAVRTWWQAIGATVAVAIGTALLDLLSGGDVFSWEFWQKVITAAVVAVLAATGAYLSRFKAPPPTVPATTTAKVVPIESDGTVYQVETEAPDGGKGPRAPGDTVG
ncbi:membrane protein [Arthrobacter phage Shambre1]|uniref:Membrane protein n=1 Tax=Arthrobacter phage Shambre1 TaxID=2927284 RepID=A0A977KNJ8_9CAUD|nr:membrane protein [Arthrobacter phage Shambre1]UXE04764.1 membrane protein [Arthrobacter phage Shambre1]